MTTDKRAELIAKFKELKNLRNNRHMDEPDFDEAVMQMIDQYTTTVAEEAYKRGHIASSIEQFNKSSKGTNL